MEGFGHYFRKYDDILFGPCFNIGSYADKRAHFSVLFVSVSHFPVLKK